MFSAPGACWSGNSASAVAIELAWISGPAITRPSPTGVACTSCSEDAVAPATTMRSLKVPGGVRPSTSRENDIVSTVPGRPAKSMYSAPSPRDSGRPPRNSSAATRAKLFSPPPRTACAGSLPSSLTKLLLPALAPIARNTRSPPKTLVPPRAFTSVVASTIPSVLITSIRALSSRRRVCSVNWMS